MVLVFTSIILILKRRSIDRLKALYLCLLFNGLTFKYCSSEIKHSKGGHSKDDILKAVKL